MIEYELDKSTFMGGWYISEKLCDDIIDCFNSNKQLHTKGQVTSEESEHNYKGVLDLSIKDSTDLTIGPYADVPPFNNYRFYLQECLNNYLEKYDDVNAHLKFNINEPYNVQHYKINKGFKKWHFEDVRIRERLLVFMTYLNNVKDGGTEFKYQNLITPAKKGLTLIWPAGWTHTHRGRVSKTKEKYIITGWYSINQFHKKEN